MGVLLNRLERLFDMKNIFYIRKPLAGDNNEICQINC